ncbi:MAG: alpha-L-fucosidase [Oscillospiraceae bacterium]|nr:alpha-L-fucosidase [Oscillospiraceae bacterium]
MKKYDIRKTPGDTSWFTADRFGMFIHWGLYAMPARHEWIKNIERIKDEKYDKYFKFFNPDMYDAKEWAKTAKNAGMKYAVLTAKHHEGFCLFDSQYTDYKATNTPAGRDLIKEYAEAFRAEGLKVGFYYSLIDWHHPDFTIDGKHPRRDDKNIEELNAGRDMKKYAEYMRNQVRELLTNYGKIDIIWFDFSYAGDYYNGMWGKGKEDWESEKLIETVRGINPDIIIDNRADIEQDLWTPEQYQPEEWIRDDDGNLVVWEACQTFSGSWGYHRDETSWKTPEMLIRMLINTVSCGGNLLLNVGPTARGYFDERANAALSAMGGWMKYNSRSIYNCTQSEFAPPADVRYTQNPDGCLYAHIYAYPFKELKLPGLSGKVEYMQFLHDGSELMFKEMGGDVYVELPHVKPDQIVPVIEIILND